MENKKISVKTMTLCGLMAAICCLLGPLSIPIGAIPVSLGVLAMYLCAYVLGPIKGVIACIVYLLLGAVGLPVFSGFEGGLQKLTGPTGGYLIGFIFLVLISGFFIDKFPVNKWYMHVIGMVLGLLVCYCFGTLYFMKLMNMDLIPSLSACVIPFLPFDAAKIAISTIIGCQLKTVLIKANLIPAYQAN
ncbi:MAG: biotin transporter BioY [Lachnospiraceae bacterium]|nr:biotin transporter BioY [Lachnospiraceae bacterium]